MRSGNILKPALTLAILLGITVAAAQSLSQPSQLTWRLDNLERAGADPFQIIGAPSIVETDIGRAIRFNGKSDGLVIGRNPLASLRQFTIEVLLSPDTDGPEEQRFLHFAGAGTENRALVELRLANGRWSLDSYLRYDAAQLTLLDRSKTHAAGQWHVAAMTFDAGRLRHFVDGVEQG